MSLATALKGAAADACPLHPGVVDHEHPGAGPATVIVTRRG
jgi:hypothetical protein